MSINWALRDVLLLQTLESRVSSQIFATRLQKKNSHMLGRGTIRQKSLFGPKVVSRFSNSCPKTVLKLCQSCINVLSNLCQRCHKDVSIFSKLFQSFLKVVSQWSKSKVISNISQKGVSLMCHCGPTVVPRWSQSGPTVVPKLSPSLRQLIQVVLKCCPRSFQMLQSGVQVVPVSAKWSPFMLPYGMLR